MKKPLIAMTRSAPGTHSQAGRLRAASARSQTAPRMDQSRAPAVACGRRSQPIALTATSATATATAAWPRVRAPPRTCGISLQAATSRLSHTASGTAGCR